MLLAVSPVLRDPVAPQLGDDVVIVEAERFIFGQRTLPVRLPVGLCKLLPHLLTRARLEELRLLAARLHDREGAQRYLLLADRLVVRRRPQVFRCQRGLKTGRHLPLITYFEVHLVYSNIII